MYRHRFLWLVGISLLSLPLSLNAQTTSGTIQGYIRDAQGAALGNAQVSARHLETGFQSDAATSSNGFYVLAGLRPGEYQISARAIGMAPIGRRVVLQVAQTLTIDLRLTPSAVQLEEVVVEAQAVPEMQTSEVASNISREQIDNLPSRNRNFLDLAGLVPGIRTEGDAFRKTFASGAQAAEQVNVFIDGASYKNDILLGGVAGQDASRGNPFPQGAIQEFRVITQNYKAEYQKASSAIITATTRSGSNRWEANLFGFGVSEDLVSRNAIEKRNNLKGPQFSRQQAGASVGGPLIRDRLFFFGNYEINFRDEPFDVLPDTTIAVPGFDARPFVGRFDTEFREHLAFGKLTYSPAPRHMVDVSFNWRRETDVRGFGARTALEAAENVKNAVFTGTGSWRYSRGGWLNEAQVTFQRYSWNPTPLRPELVGLNYFDIGRFGGKDTRQDFTQSRISLRNDATFLGRGQHTLKAGVSLDFLRYEAIKELFGNPVFQFRAAENWQRPFEALFGFGDPKIAANNTQLGVYVQDDWNVSQRLVLNLGLRWDVETNMINNKFVTPQGIRDSLSGVLRDSLYNMVRDSVFRNVDSLGGLDQYFTDGNDRSPYLGAFQPRVGFSFDVSGEQQTVLFGGIGLFFDRDYWNLMLDEEYRRQFRILRIDFNDTGPTAGCPACVQWDSKYFNRDSLLTLAASGQAGAPEVFLIENDTKPPKSVQWSAGVRHRAGSVLLSATYTGVRGYNGFAFVFGSCCGRLGPNYSNLLVSTDDIRSWYNALLVKVEKPLAGNARWGGSIAYTFGKAEQQGEYFFSLDDRYGNPTRYPREPARGTFTNLGSDQRHNLVANGIFRLPYDLLFSTVFNLGSEFPLFGTDASQGFGPNQRRTVVFRPPAGVGETISLRSFDLRLAKDFTFGRGQGIGVVLDLFNALNLTQYGCYDVFIAQLPGVNANFGRPQCAAEGRRLQLGLRYDYRPAVGARVDQ